MGDRLGRSFGNRPTVRPFKPAVSGLSVYLMTVCRISQLRSQPVAIAGRWFAVSNHRLFACANRIPICSRRFFRITLELIPVAQVVRNALERPQRRDHEKKDRKNSMPCRDSHVAPTRRPSDSRRACGTAIPLPMPVVSSASRFRSD